MFIVGKEEYSSGIHLLIMFIFGLIYYFVLLISLLPKATKWELNLHVMAGPGCSGLEVDCCC